MLLKTLRKYFRIGKAQKVKKEKVCLEAKTVEDH